MALKILKVVLISLYSWSRETTARMILRQGETGDMETSLPLTTDSFCLKTQVLLIKLCNYK